MANCPRRERDGVSEPTEQSMALASYLGERLNYTLFGNTYTYVDTDYLNMAAAFRITPQDVELFYGRGRGGNPPPMLTDYLKNVTAWSDQLPRKGEKEEEAKPEEEKEMEEAKPAEEEEKEEAKLAEEEQEPPTSGDRKEAEEAEGGAEEKSST